MFKGKTRCGLEKPQKFYDQDRFTKMKKTLDDMRVMAKAKGGVLLSTVYVNAITKLLWRCGSQHEFSATPNSIQSGHWCPNCSRLQSGDSQRLGIKFFKRLAEDRGGECLSAEYKTIKAALKWRCSFGHVWESRADVIKKGGWCPICGGSTFEEVVRSILQTSLSKQFPKTRPSWLLNSRGNQMELDGFCEDLMLAFEYQGIQHYKEITHFHKKTQLTQRVEDDLLKQSLCQRNGVTLLVVPYTVPVRDLPSYLQKECSRLGFEGGQFTWNEKYIYGRKVRELDSLKQLAKDRNGQLLSHTYLTATTPLLWRCEKQHTWEATSSVIKRGVWCPICGRDKARIAITTNIETFKRLAEKKGGVCLTTKRTPGDQRLKFRCAIGHEWTTDQHSIKKGHWCPKCSRSGTGARYSIEDAQAIATKNGGDCLSTTYHGAQNSLEWMCSEGHRFKASVRAARLRWCPACEKSRKFLQLCIDRAAEHGGKLLSRRYTSAREKMEWQCSFGHIWATSWTSVSSGRWCPVCGRINQWAKRRGVGERLE